MLDSTLRVELVFLLDKRLRTLKEKGTDTALVRFARYPCWSAENPAGGRTRWQWRRVCHYVWYQIELFYSMLTDGDTAIGIGGRSRPGGRGR